MKFSDIERERWDELKPYLDTCLLPITGMNGSEEPYEATEWLERLRDVMDLIEIPFKGRVVTYPAFHYIFDNSDTAAQLAQWCAAMRGAGFKYIIAATANANLDLEAIGADLIVKPDEHGGLPKAEDVSSGVRAMWSVGTA